nr:PD-(D/E)XK nuclease family protein [bacterium]
SEEALLPFRVASPLAPLPVDARAVIVPRMLEGNVPRPLFEPAFFANWDEPRVSSAIPPPAELFAAGAYAFETAAAKCGERLVLLYPAVDDAGKETLRSSFLDRFLCEGAKPEYAPAITPRPSAAGLPGWEGRLSVAVGVEGARRGGRERRPGFSGELSSKEAISVVAKRFGEEDIRVTALEDYAECPFAFFVSHVLGAREKPDDTPELSPLARGTIVHDILKLFYSRHAKEAVAARRDAVARKEIEAVISRLTAEVWDDHKRDVAGVAPGLVARGRRSIGKLVMQVVDAEIDEARRLPSPMIPLECEWPFGSAEGCPLTVEIGRGERASLSGRIDRVDADESGSSFLVIDYKTGATGPVIGDMKKGLHLQLPLYVDAAGRFLCPRAKAMGGLILDVRNARAGCETHTEGKTHGFVRGEGANEHFRIGRKKSALDDSDFEAAIESAHASAAA